MLFFAIMLINRVLESVVKLKISNYDLLYYHNSILMIVDSYYFEKIVSLSLQKVK